MSNLTERFVIPRAMLALAFAPFVFVLLMLVEMPGMIRAWRRGKTATREDLQCELWD